MEAICNTCMHNCRLKEGQWGICRARKCENGNIVCKSYGIVSSLALDPIEKKPLYMFYPGSSILSVGSFGCNLRCPFCQNHDISMRGAEELDLYKDDNYVAPDELCALSIKYKEKGNIGVAFTYNEPLAGWEYVLDTAKLLKKEGMKCVLVTNGSAGLNILDELLPYVDAMNIDLKGFSDDYYDYVKGSFEYVKKFISHAAKECHIELTTLIVPGKNDSVRDMEDESLWIASVDKTIPLHITRFFPRYKVKDINATDVKTVYALADVARKHLDNVFTGNC